MVTISLPADIAFWFNKPNTAIMSDPIYSLTIGLWADNDDIGKMFVAFCFRKS